MRNFHHLNGILGSWFESLVWQSMLKCQRGLQEIIPQSPKLRGTWRGGTPSRSSSIMIITSPEQGTHPSLLHTLHSSSLHPWDQGTILTYSNIIWIYFCSSRDNHFRFETWNIGMKKEKKEEFISRRISYTILHALVLFCCVTDYHKHTS